MMEIVNGYLCLTSADVALAEQGKNPANPNAATTSSNAPSASNAADAASKTRTTNTARSTDNAGGVDKTDFSASTRSTASAHSVRSQPSVTFGGSLSQTDPSLSSGGAAQAGAPYQPGDMLRLTA